MTLLRRAAGAERMDDPATDPGALARSLADLRTVNRWLGGTRVALRHFAAMVRRHPRPRYRVLDVATGSADIPLRLVEWGRANGVEVEVVATDLHPGTLDAALRRTAGEAAVTVEAADARALPYEEAAFDLALCSTALHHFDRVEELLAVLAGMARVARIGGVVSDLRRSLPALAGAHLLAATVWRRHPITRHDGPLSVRRALTPEELAFLADAVGLPEARVHTHLPFRLALTWERPG